MNIRILQPQLKCALLMAVAVLPSCVSYYRIPEDYNGPRATIKDSATNVSPVKAEVFRVHKIDGQLDANTPMATPYGGGMGVTLRDSKREVPARSLTLSLTGGEAYAADGVEIVDRIAGKRRKSVTGDVRFAPKPNRTYVVKGRTGKVSSSVWLEEEGTGKVVTQRVTGSD